MSICRENKKNYDPLTHFCEEKKKTHWKCGPLNLKQTAYLEEAYILNPCFFDHLLFLNKFLRAFPRERQSDSILPPKEVPIWILGPETCAMF